LIRLSAASRIRLSQEAAIIRRRLDAPMRVVQSLRDHPVRWVGGTLVTGLAATLLFRRKTAAPKPKRGLPAALFSLVLASVRPIIKTWLGVQLEQYIVSQLRAAAVSRPPANGRDTAKPR